DVEVRFAARDANANGRALGARDVALAHPRAARGERAPRVADHEEFALDLLRHAPSVSRGFSIVTTIMKPRTTPSPRRGACAGTYRARAPRAIDNRARRRGFSRRGRALQGGTTRRRCGAASPVRAGARAPPRRCAADRA